MTDIDHNEEHGETYAEACDRALTDIVDECESLNKQAEELRDEGGIGNSIAASILELRANELAKKGLELAKKRQKMPFGLDSAQGFGETIGSPAVTLAEQIQRGETDDSKPRVE